MTEVVYYSSCRVLVASKLVTKLIKYAEDVRYRWYLINDLWCTCFDIVREVDLDGRNLVDRRSFRVDSVVIKVHNLELLPLQVRDSYFDPVWDDTPRNSDIQSYFIYS